MFLLLQRVWNLYYKHMETQTHEKTFITFCHCGSCSVPRNGEKWYNFRAVLNKRMLHPRDSAQYCDTLNDVVTDFIKRMCYLRQGSPTGDLVPDIANEFYRFSLEGTWKNLNLHKAAQTLYFSEPKS